MKSIKSSFYSLLIVSIVFVQTTLTNSKKSYGWLSHPDDTKRSYAISYLKNGYKFLHPEDFNVLFSAPEYKDTSYPLADVEKYNGRSYPINTVLYCSNNRLALISKDPKNSSQYRVYIVDPMKDLESTILVDSKEKADAVLRDILNEKYNVDSKSYFARFIAWIKGL